MKQVLGCQLLLNILKMFKSKEWTYNNMNMMNKTSEISGSMIDNLIYSCP